MDPEEEQRRRDEEARRAVEDAMRASEMAFESIATGRPVGDDDEEPAEAQPLGNRRFTGDFEPEASERISRVDARLQSDPYAVEADVEAGRDADPRPPPRTVELDPVVIPRRVPQASDLRQPPRSATLADPSEATPAAQRAMASEVRKPAMATDDEARESFLEGQGLPSRGDISGAEGRDVARRIPHALGAALLAASGRTARPFRSEAEQLRTRQAEGLERGATAKRQGVQDAARSRALEVQSRGQELEAEHAERADALAALRAQSEERLREARVRLAEAQTGSEMREAARDVEAADPASATSARARARYVISALDRERLLPARERRGREEIEQTAAGLAAIDIEALEGEMASVTMGSRRGGGSPGGGGIRVPGGTMPLEQFRQIYSQRTGRSAEEADAVYANPRARQTFLSQLAGIPPPASATAGARAGVADDDPEYRMYGYERRTGDADTPELDRTQIRTIRERVRSMEVIESLTNELERLTGEISAAEQAGAAIGQLSDQVADAQQLHEQVINALRDIGNYGVPTGNELQRMEALAPQLTSLQGIRNARTQYRALRGGMRRRTDAQMMVDGYRRAGGGPRTVAPHPTEAQPTEAQPAAQPPQAGGYVRMTRPDGQTVRVLASRQSEAESAGYSLAQ